MKNDSIVTEIGPEDVRLILDGKAPSLKLRYALYKRVQVRRLRGLTPAELREEFEKNFEPSIIIEFFLGRAANGKGTTRDNMIEMLLGVIMDSYAEETEAGE